MCKNCDCKERKSFPELREISNECDPAQISMTITDQRDIDEMKRRKAAKTIAPSRDELYSVNPNFNGIYTDPGRVDNIPEKEHKPTWSVIMAIVNGGWKHVAGQPYFELTVSLPEKSVVPVYCNGRTVTGGAYKFKSREAAMEAVRIMHADDYLAMEGIQ